MYSYSEPKKKKKKTRAEGGEGREGTTTRTILNSPSFAFHSIPQASKKEEMKKEWRFWPHSYTPHPALKCCLPHPRARVEREGGERRKRAFVEIEQKDLDSLIHHARPLSLPPPPSLTPPPFLHRERLPTNESAVGAKKSAKGAGSAADMASSAVVAWYW
jgi:hypothetical protein